MRPCGLIVRIGDSAFDPGFAVFEELVFPDRRDLFDAFDRVAADLKRLGRCAAAAATITTLASPTSSRPVRWTIPSAEPGHCSATSAWIRSKTLIASASNAWVFQVFDDPSFVRVRGPVQKRHHSATAFAAPGARRLDSVVTASTDRGR